MLSYDFEFHKIVMGQVIPKETADEFVTVDYTSWKGSSQRNFKGSGERLEKLNIR